MVRDDSRPPPWMRGRRVARGMFIIFYTGAMWLPVRRYHRFDPNLVARRVLPRRRDIRRIRPNLRATNLNSKVRPAIHRAPLKSINRVLSLRVGGCVCVGGIPEVATVASGRFAGVMISTRDRRAIARDLYMRLENVRAPGDFRDVDFSLPFHYSPEFMIEYPIAPSQEGSLIGTIPGPRPRVESVPRRRRSISRMDWSRAQSFKIRRYA